MFFYVVAGVFSAFAIIFLLAKFDFGKVLWLDIPIDIASTALLVAMFAGTFAGMMAAVIGGVHHFQFPLGLKEVQRIQETYLGHIPLPLGRGKAKIGFLGSQQSLACWAYPRRMWTLTRKKACVPGIRRKQAKLVHLHH